VTQSVVVFGLALAGCPKPRVVEHGVVLQWKKASSEAVRDVVEKRLALAKLKGRVVEDDDRVQVRVPTDGDAAWVKALISLPGTFELCEDLGLDAGVGRTLPTQYEVFDDAPRAYTVPTTCLEPRVVSGELKGQGFAQVTWDAESAQEVGQLTQRLVGQRLIFVVDGRVALAAVVTSPITGTHSVVPIDTDRRLDALAGGPLRGLSFVSEKPYP
jgi:preprotein translocase subunit SecD